MVEKLEFDSEIYGILIRHSFSNEGISFFTPENFSQQLGYMKREKGYEIPPHVHNVLLRNVTLTQEVLYIKSGKVRVDFYKIDKTYLWSKILYSGDVILLADGGHGFTMLEDSEIIEIKQGPYCGDKDKTRFLSINDNNQTPKII